MATPNINCLLDQENKVFKEVLWGTNIRLDKIQERKQEKIQQDTIKRYKKKCKKRKKQQSKLKCYCPGLLTKLDNGNNCNEIIDRRTLTRAEHSKLLATPKCEKICVHEVCLPKKIVLKKKNIQNAVPPRYHILSLPKAQQVLNTWKRFQYYMRPEKIIYIRELLKKIDSLTTSDANKYFNKLTTLQRKHVKGSKNRPNKTFICHGRSRAKRDIDRFIDKVMKYFDKKPLGQVKYRHTIITTEIINTLTHKSLCGVFNRCSKHPYSVTLYDFVDQLSIWIDQKINEIDLIDLSEKTDGETLTITISGTDSSATDSSYLCSMERDTDSRRKKKHGDDDDSEGDSDDGASGKGKRGKKGKLGYPYDEYCEGEAGEGVNYGTGPGRKGQKTKGGKKAGALGSDDEEYDESEGGKTGKRKGKQGLGDFDGEEEGEETEARRIARLKAEGEGESEYEAEVAAKLRLEQVQAALENEAQEEAAKVEAAKAEAAKAEAAKVEAAKVEAAKAEAAKAAAEVAKAEAAKAEAAAAEVAKAEAAAAQEQAKIDAIKQKLESGLPLTEEEKRLMEQIAKAKAESGEPLTEDEKRILNEIAAEKLKSGQPLTEEESKRMAEMLKQKAESGEPLTEEEKQMMNAIMAEKLNSGQPLTEEESKMMAEILKQKAESGEPLTEEEKRIMNSIMAEKIKSGQPLTEEESKMMAEMLRQKAESGEPLTEDEKRILTEIMMQKLKSGEPLTAEEQALMAQIAKQKAEAGEPLSEDEKRIMNEILTAKLNSGEPLTEEEALLMAQILKQKAENGEPLTEEEKLAMKKLQEDLEEKLKSGVPLTEEEQLLLERLQKEAEWEKEKEQLEKQMQMYGEDGVETCPFLPIVEADKTVLDTSQTICRPCAVTEHSPDVICCLTLKIWAAWLLEVAHNTQTWCKWVTETIGQIRLYAAMLRGEVKDASGTVQILRREEWDEFKAKIEQDKISFLQYNMHVQELSEEIIKKFHGKRVECCPYCLQEKLILSVDQGHEITQQLTEAIRTSSYWRRWLENLIEHADKLAAITLDECVCGAIEGIGSTAVSSLESSIYEIIELSVQNDQRGNRKNRDQHTANTSCNCSDVYTFEDHQNG